MCRVIGYLGEQNGTDVLRKNLGNQSLYCVNTAPNIHNKIRRVWDNPADKTGYQIRSFIYETNGNFSALHLPPASPLAKVNVHTITDTNPLSESLTLEIEFATILRTKMSRKSISLLIFRGGPKKKIIIARCGGPALSIGFKDDGIIIASSLSDIRCHTEEYRVLEDNEIVVLSREGARFFTLDARPVRRVLYGLQEERLSLQAVTVSNRFTDPLLPPGFYPDFTDTSKQPHNRQKECLFRSEESMASSSNGVLLNRPVNRR